MKNPDLNLIEQIQPVLTNNYEILSDLRDALYEDIKTEEQLEHIFSQIEKLFENNETMQKAIESNS